MREALGLSIQLFKKMLGDDYSAAVQELAKLLDEDLSQYYLPPNIYAEYNNVHPPVASKAYLEGKLIPLISSLEYGYHLNEEVAEVGTLYGSLEDEELRGSSPLAASSIAS
jgi:hypothetical protein